MPKRQRLPELAIAALLILSLSVAAATTEPSTFGRDLAAVPLDALLLAGLLSFCGGLASTLYKLTNRADQVRSVPLEIAKDLVGSVVAGFVIFALCEAWNMETMYQVASILLAGFLGATLLDRLARAWFDRLFPSSYQGEERRHRTEHPEVERRRAPEPDPED